MPNWKKVVVSGSDATLNSLEVVHASGSFSGSFQGDGSGLTGIAANSVGFSNEVTLSSNYTTTTDTYNALHGPLSLEADVTISVTEGSFLKIEDFNNVFSSISASFAETASYYGGNVSSASYAETASFIEIAQSASYVLNAISSSFATNSESSSLAETASYYGGFVNTAITSSYGNNFTASSLFVEGTASITYLEFIYETSSIIYSSGSTKFGDDTIDTHERTGSLEISGSLSVIGNSNLVASQSVNNNALSASLSFWQGSEAEYDLISASADPNTVYFIT
jgi:hypothetical protein